MPDIPGTDKPWAWSTGLGGQELAVRSARDSLRGKSKKNKATDHNPGFVHLRPSPSFETPSVLF